MLKITNKNLTFTLGYFSIDQDTKKIAGIRINTGFSAISSCEASGIRTPDNLIKSQVLYHLS